MIENQSRAACPLTNTIKVYQRISVRRHDESENESILKKKKIKSFK